MSGIINLAISWGILTLGFVAAGALVPGFKVKDWKGGMVAAAIFGVLSVTLGTLLFVVFGLGSLGLAWLFDGVTTLVISIILIKIADAMSDSVEVDGILPAALASIVIAVVKTVAAILLR